MMQILDGGEGESGGEGDERTGARSVGQAGIARIESTTEWSCDSGGVSSQHELTTLRYTGSYLRVSTVYIGERVNSHVI
jgi:hypothetical protein